MQKKLLAKDIMSEQVLMVYEGWSISRLAEFFSKHDISGAPVIASDHSLVGVVSSSDIVRFEGADLEKKSAWIEEVYTEYLGHHYDQNTRKELSKKAAEFCTVNQIMTPNVIQVDAQTPLSELAYTMLQSNVRRVFVTKQGIIRGVVSTKNILQALTYQDL